MLQKGPKNAVLRLGARVCVLAPADKAPELIPTFSVATVDCIGRRGHLRLASRCAAVNANSK
jgi:hypothetical protein